ncbi:protein adenylyltransferase SelO [Jeotgalibacillus proteolyticus]|uniref:protein adenylyltransferase SelO n=1 Tax=Jeotgalibacillus proteolyticus TaxID=2082395 RepID=UPI003CEE24FE
MTQSNAGWNLENSYSRLPSIFFASLDPKPVQSPEIVQFNDSLAESLGLSNDALNSEKGAAIFAGNKMFEGSMPIAQAYAGHQFGNLTMLGDGRALLIGEQITPENKRFDIQLKGSGRTPFSRGGDGRAALGPMLREYVISEAMHALGIPTTRSLAVVKTGEEIIRETLLPGAVMTRVASSHLRFGTFQYAAGVEEGKELKALADYAIERHYPELAHEENRYRAFLRKVIEQHAVLIAKWQQVGFIHGVMNTDNMTISGETIDYGPCAFMDAYDPATVFSSIDVQGRYAYGNQPKIGGWNLARFAETLLPLLHEEQEKAVEIAQNEIEAYGKLYHEQWLSNMRGKLGLFGSEEGDEELVEELLGLMKDHKSDFTNTFRMLTDGTTENDGLFTSPEFKKWETKWKERRSSQTQSQDETKKRMQQHNPVIIARNHKVEEALEAAVRYDDYTLLTNLLEVLSSPYDYSSSTQSEYCIPRDPSNGRYRTFCGT